MEILEIKNIHKSFEDKEVHKGVSFSLKAGETVGLLGHSGTGKSVLLRSIIGLEHIDEGEIYFHSQRIDTLSESKLYPIRTKVSYAFFVYLLGYNVALADTAECNESGTQASDTTFGNWVFLDWIIKEYRYHCARQK